MTIPAKPDASATRRQKVKSAEMLGGYFCLRDFEYAQPLYDLAFLLEIQARANATDAPKYRTFGLWRAAIGIDGYTSIVDHWLNGEVNVEDLDNPPSVRIKGYLRTIRKSGSLEELQPFLITEDYRRCLRLRSLRGLGVSQIAETVGSPEVSPDWLRRVTASTGRASDEILAYCFGQTYGIWQSAHIVPPLLRFLRCVEQSYGSELTWQLTGISDPFLPVSDEIIVSATGADKTKLNRAYRKALGLQVLFGDLSTRGCTRARHQMGWSFQLSLEQQAGTDYRLSELMEMLDPLSRNQPKKLRGDLHLHTSWSDGSASISGMAKAALDRGNEYIAVTDHSRSCKLQNGLTPIDWLRQANSLLIEKPVLPILHGIEVDILADGTLDLPLELLESADIVVASVHSSWTLNRLQNTRRLITAIESGVIDIIGHPTSAILGKPGVPDYVRLAAKIDWEDIFASCARWNVALEFNCFPSRFDLPLDLIEQALAAGCWISFGTDAHARSHLVHEQYAEAVIQRLQTDKCLNLLPFRDLIDWVQSARRLRQTLRKSIHNREQAEFAFESSRVERKERTPARISPPRQIPDGGIIVGFDLTGSEKKATGVAKLANLRVETCSILSDDELVDFVKQARPKILSIDSPLGLPGGNNIIDPAAGIVRVAESDLSSIGINAYPALIDSMKNLTLRGIGLRRRIEELPFSPTVIESYPGAAQDILCLPRKQRSLDLLREGLRELGLTGPGLDSISHDEIDAITSAIVGRYFESGLFEPMGVPSEAQLIVPKTQPLTFARSPIICLAGKTGAGKSVVARYLAVFYGFRWLRTRDLIRTLLIEDTTAPPKDRMFDRTVNPETITENDLKEFGALILDKYKQEPLRAKLTETIRDAEGPTVVDSIRAMNDFDEAQVKDRFVCVWYVDCSDPLIRKRLTERAKLNFKKGSMGSPVDRSARSLQEKANLVISNMGSFEELRWRVDDKLLSHLSIHKTTGFRH
jgi:histidinol phosphatase-like PHP family hydrolase/predicted nuclease with RNAse H fold/dephospho-CoA kinase